MINKSKTLTVAELLSILSDKRINPDMPLTTRDNSSGAIRGVVAFDIHTYEDGSQALSIFDGEKVAAAAMLVSCSEVFPLNS